MTTDVARERCREPTPVTPHYAPFPTYKTAGGHRAYRIRSVPGEITNSRATAARKVSRILWQKTGEALKAPHQA